MKTFCVFVNHVKLIKRQSYEVNMSYQLGILLIPVFIIALL